MKIKSVMKSINDNLFEALAHDYSLQKYALKNDEAPQATVKNHLTGRLNLSADTINSLGSKFYYYVHLKAPKTTEDMRDSISSYFRADVSWQSLTHVRFLDIARVAVDMYLPIEQLLYGTTNLIQIARFNYRYYDDLGKIRRDYLVFQNKRFHTVAHCAELWHTHVNGKSYPYTKVAKDFHISRPTLYDYLKGSSVLLRKRALYSSMCKTVGKDPVKLMIYPLISRDVLQRFIAKMSK